MRKIWIAGSIGVVITLLLIGSFGFYFGVGQKETGSETTTSITKTTTTSQSAAKTTTVTQSITKQANSTITQTITQKVNSTTTTSQTNQSRKAAPPSGGTLQVQVEVANAVITRGSEQTIYVTITSDGNAIEGAEISGVVTYASGSTRPFSGSTSADGTYRYSWQIGGNSNPGTFSVSVTAGKSGYTSGQGYTEFTVKTKSG